MTLNLFRFVAVAVLLTGLLVAGGSWAAAGVDQVSTGEQGALSGGGNRWCIWTEIACPDQAISANCAMSYGMVCKQCTMNVVSWTQCFYSYLERNDCTQTVSPTSPHCGTVWYDDPVGGACPACTQQGGDCGKQIPTTTGVPC